MDIKKHTFDVLNAEDMTRSFTGCIMRFNDSIIRIGEFNTNDAGVLGCYGQKIRVEPGVELIGREFRLGINQMRALTDPDNLLPFVRAGHVNVPDAYTGKLLGHFCLSRKVGGYVRGYGPRSTNVTYAEAVGNDAYYEQTGISDGDRILRVLHAAFTGGNYLTANEAYGLLEWYSDRQMLALTHNVLMQKYGSGIRVLISNGIGSFQCVRNDEGQVRFDASTNSWAPPGVARMYTRIISKVIPCL